MKNATRLTAIVTAAMFMFATAQTAQADDRNGSRHSGASTTEKVLTAAAVGAVAGLLIYAATRDDDQHRRDYRSHYTQRRPDWRNGPRNYAAFNVGFQSFRSGDPRGHHYREHRGYWYRFGGNRFYRVPFRYNARFSRAYNAGWERGYWAGYLQGLQDARMRGQYFDRFQWQGRGPLWGYNSSYGAAGQYQEAFHAAFSIGYRHAFRGYGYGHDGFGFGLQFSYRR